jgi:hypothetical protein
MTDIFPSPNFPASGRNSGVAQALMQADLGSLMLRRSGTMMSAFSGSVAVPRHALQSH